MIAINLTLYLAVACAVAGLLLFVYSVSRQEGCMADMLEDEFPRTLIGDPNEFSEPL